MGFTNEQALAALELSKNNLVIINNNLTNDKNIYILLNKKTENLNYLIFLNKYFN